MTAEELHEILRTLRSSGSDSAFIEAKRAERDLSRSLRETLSAFSNTPGGGVIVLGMDETHGFAVTGVSDPKKTTHDLGCMCSEMEPPVRALIQTHTIEGQVVVTAEVPEIELQRKPCYYSGAGMTNGAFIRVADGDRKLTPYEVAMMLASRGQPREDEAPVPEATMADFDPALTSVLLGRLRATETGAFQRMDDQESLLRLKALVRDGIHVIPSVGGLLALGRFPQQFLPALGATFVVYPTPRVGEPGPNGERFLDNVRIEGPVPIMVKQALAVLQRHMKQRAVIRGLFREETWEYPLTALREAIANALIHRDLSSFARGTPVQIAMFPDRLAIVNPGGLFGPVTLDRLGEPGISAGRNQVLMKLLEDIVVPGESYAVCENRGSGMGAMLAALRQAGMSPPRFDNRVSSFQLTFPNHTLLDDATLKWLERIGASDLTDSQRMALALMRQGNEMNNPAYREFAGLDSRVVTRELGELVERRLLDVTGSGRWTSYRLRVSAGNEEESPLANRERHLLSVLVGKGPLSRAEIAAALGWKDITTRSWLQRLIKRKLVRTLGPKRSPQTKYLAIST